MHVDLWPYVMENGLEIDAHKSAGKREARYGSKSGAMSRLVQGLVEIRIVWCASKSTLNAPQCSRRAEDV